MPYRSIDSLTGKESCQLEAAGLDGLLGRATYLPADYTPNNRELTLPSGFDTVFNLPYNSKFMHVLTQSSTCSVHTIYFFPHRSDSQVINSAHNNL